jgi:hypothetical protein
MYELDLIYQDRNNDCRFALRINAVPRIDTVFIYYLN